MSPILTHVAHGGTQVTLALNLASADSGRSGWPAVAGPDQAAYVHVEGPIGRTFLD